MRKAIFGAIAIILLAGPMTTGQAQEFIVEAAKKARAQKKAAPKGPVFTNDNIENVRGTVNVVGTVPAPPADVADKTAGEEKAEAAKPAAKDDKAAPVVKDEAYWRKRFAEARKQLADAEKEADILQRELNLQNQQYDSDPNKALQEQYSRKQINDLRQKIDEKKAEVARLKQGISDLEDEMRAAGGEPGWAREQ